MTVGDLPESQLRQLTRQGRLHLRVGPFLVRIRSTIRSVQHYVGSHYRDFPIAPDGGAHFDIAVGAPGRIRRWIRPQAAFSVNGRAPFLPVPARLAPGVFEWGFNWCVGELAHQLLVLHSAVVEREGRAALLPAPPGSGKSTLSTSLAFSGWRLMSDEFGLVDPATGEIRAIPRPIALKQGSIELLAARIPGLRLGPRLEDVEGVVVRYAAPPAEAVRVAGRAARVRWIVVPQWKKDSPTLLQPLSRARTLAHLANSAFNFNMLGETGFTRLAEIVDGALCYVLTYSDLDEALALFDDLSRDVAVRETGWDDEAS